MNVNDSNQSKVLRLAMWSGPRNISTALMRSWGNRADTIVCDEPFYAHYLRSTGITTHPGFQEIIDHHEGDWDKIVDWLTGPLPTGKTVFYQKHMAHHMLQDRDYSWTDSVINCLLIREPREMITSLAEFLPQPTLEETGLPHQAWLFDYLTTKNSKPPIVLDTKDVLLDPPRMLRLLCQRLGVDFTDEMLHWRPGLRTTDGVWAKFWYTKVAESTTFNKYIRKDVEVPKHLMPLLVDCEKIYDRLYSHRLI
jgi:hypothetical protein